MEPILQGLEDLSNGTDAAIKSNIIHVVAERFANSNYESTKEIGIRNDEHEVAIVAQEKHFKSLFPNSIVRFQSEGIEDISLVKWNSETNTGTINHVMNFREVRLIMELEVVLGPDNRKIVTNKVTNNYVELDEYDENDNFVRTTIK